MHLAIIVVLTIILVAAIITMIYITLYNKIQFSKTRIDQAQKMIVEELNNRYDLIMKCNQEIEKNTKKELTLFSELEQLKEKNISSYELEKKIRNSINTIYLIKKDYPKIEEKKSFKEIIRKLNESDTKIEAAKSFYNKNNISLNTSLKKFPSNIIGKIAKIDILPNYEGKEMFNELEEETKI